MTTKDSSDLQLQIQYRLFEELRESEKRYREFVEHLREIIFECDNEGHLTFLNQAWSGIFGHPAARFPEDVPSSTSSTRRQSEGSCPL